MIDQTVFLKQKKKKQWTYKFDSFWDSSISILFLYNKYGTKDQIKIRNFQTCYAKKLGIFNYSFLGQAVHDSDICL